MGTISVILPFSGFWNAELLRSCKWEGSHKMPLFEWELFLLKSSCETSENVNDLVHKMWRMLDPGT